MALISDYDLQTLGKLKGAWRLTPATMRAHLTRHPVTKVSSWIPAKHLLYLSTKIATGLKKGGLRLVVEVPPRHGKSELISVTTPMYHFDHWPDRNVILTSYGSELADGFSRKVRDSLLEYENQLRCRVRADKRQVSHFITTDGGEMFSSGVGGTLTGRGGHLLIVDDFIKNAAHAASEVLRENDWEWFTSTLYTRLEPNASVIILATRWNIDDIIGRIREQFPDMWEFIKIKAVCEDEDDPLGRQIGEPLWPMRYDREALKNIERVLGTYYWRSLYQQEPIAGMAGLFKGAWLNHKDYSPHPGLQRTVRFWDFAASEDTGDWTVGILLGEHKETKQVTILDVHRGQWASGRVEQEVLRVSEHDTLMWPDYEVRMEQEPGASGKAVVNHFAQDVLAAHTAKGERVTGPLEVRIRPFFAAAETGQIDILTAPWNSVLKQELEAFDEGKHDDQVVAIAGAYNALKERHMRGLTWGRAATQGDPVGVIRNAAQTSKPRLVFGR